jgi:hypothetical protein
MKPKNMNSFDIYQSSISREAIENYLLNWQRKGYKIIQGRPQIKNGWSVEFGNSKWIGVLPHPNTEGFWCISDSNSAGRTTGPKGSMEEIKFSFENASHQLGIDLESIPKQHHTSKNEPFSVWVKLNSIINKATIMAIYDPYLKMDALKNLIGLACLGADFSKDLKLLTWQTDISTNFLSKFNKELGINAVLKLTSKNHPRFILLNDGRCIEITFSLNLEQDGTIVTVETAPKQAIFDSEWSTANLLI